MLSRAAEQQCPRVSHRMCREEGARIHLAYFQAKASLCHRRFKPYVSSGAGDIAAPATRDQEPDVALELCVFLCLCVCE